MKCKAKETSLEDRPDFNQKRIPKSRFIEMDCNEEYSYSNDGKHKHKSMGQRATPPDI